MRKCALRPLLSPYTDLALVRLAVGREEDAWIAAERGLARTLAGTRFPRLGTASIAICSTFALLGERTP